MSDWVEVANLAGAAIGASTRITSPDDNRTLARNLRAVWDLQRRAVIRDGSWNFATSRQALPALKDAPAFGYAYAYQLPALCLRLLEVIDITTSGDYQLEGRTILTDIAAPLKVRLLLDVTEPALWDEEFSQSFALRLAWAIGTKIAGSTFDKDKVWRDYKSSLASAKRVDAMENPPIDEMDSNWITDRWFPGTTGMLNADGFN